MERFNRAVRRHHVQRLKLKRKNYWGYGPNGHRQGHPVMPPNRLGQVVKHPAVCSCWMCGNDRKYFGHVSVGERRSIDVLAEELKDLKF